MASTKSQEWLDAPESKNTVRVRMIDTTAKMVLHSSFFIDPVVPGHEKMSMTDVAFLIENERLGKKAMFDLGVRKDYWNLPPVIRQRFDMIALGLRVDKDVPDILQENGLQLAQINDIIWSHSHWDHTGDPSLFPTTTTLSHGPDIDTTPSTTYPTNKTSPLPSSNFTTRLTNKITFPPTCIKIGGFPAHDFYADGSFYLLETPGHSKGHMCGLARTSTTPDGKSTWILLGGDVCHFCGDMRPSARIPLPTGTIEVVRRDGDDVVVDSKAYLAVHPRCGGLDSERRTTPWYGIPTHEKSAYDYPSPRVAQRTIDTLRDNLDGKRNVFVALAHDTALLGYVPTFNEWPGRDMNCWFEEGWKERGHWGWLGELRRDDVVVEGFWREGRKYGTAKELIDDFEAGKADEQ